LHIHRNNLQRSVDVHARLRTSFQGILTLNMTQHIDPYIKDEFDGSDIDFDTLCRDMEFGSMREESLCA